MRTLLAVLAVAIMIVLGWNTVLDLIGKGEQEGTPPAAMRFAQAAREQQVIPPEPKPREEQSSRGNGRLDLANCTAARISDYSQEPFRATLVKVIDGDTIVVNIQGSQASVRLWGIDAPELSQPQGDASRDHLMDLMAGQSNLTIHPVETDVYGRIVALIGEDDGWAINMKMVLEGHAYHLDDFLARGNPCLQEAERFAQDQRYGIWRNGTGGTRPWDHRSGGN